VIYLIGCDHRNAQTYRNDSSLTDSENCKQAELRDSFLLVSFLID